MKLIKFWDNFKNLFTKNSQHIPAEDFTEILQRTTEGFFTLDSNWRMTYANPVTKDFFALVGKDLIGKSMDELFPSSDRERFMVRYRKVADTGTPERFEDLRSRDRRTWMGKCTSSR